MGSEAGERLDIAFVGTADFAVPTLHALAAAEEITAVFTRPDRPAGRGRRLTPPPVKQAAEAGGVPVYQPERVSGEEGVRLLRSLAPDLVAVVAFGEILSGEVLSVARLGAINTHASLLPRYRGAAPIQRALLAGDRATGVTVQWMSAEMDAGDILLQREVAIGEEEGFGSLHDRLAALAAELTVESAALIRAGKPPRIPQDNEQATYAPAIQRQELLVDWTRPAEELARRVRAFAPSPGARTTREGAVLKLLAARAGKNAASSGGIPGEIMELTCGGFWVATGDGWLLVTHVQPAGRRAMSAADYLKGHRLPAGERLGL